MATEGGPCSTTGVRGNSVIIIVLRDHVTFAWEQKSTCSERVPIVLGTRKAKDEARLTELAHVSIP